MKLPRLPILLALSIAGLGACKSAPKPPAVDESTRRPANSTQALELQACQHEVRNAQLREREYRWIAESATRTRERLAGLQRAIDAMAPAAHVVSPSPAQGNSVYVLHFAYGSSRLDLAGDMAGELAATLKRDTRDAPLVVLRGRTDGTSDSPAESRIAQSRAAAVRDYLVAAGVDPRRIRTTYQPVGDHLADNATSEGRGRNRRVEIEVYRALPLQAGAAAALQAGLSAGPGPATPAIAASTQ